MATAFSMNCALDNFNESQDLQLQLEQYKQRFGYYPESVHVDRIYRAKAKKDNKKLFQ